MKIAISFILYTLAFFIVIFLTGCHDDHDEVRIHPDDIVSISAPIVGAVDGVRDEIDQEGSDLESAIEGIGNVGTVSGETIVTGTLDHFRFDVDYNTPSNATGDCIRWKVVAEGDIGIGPLSALIIPGQSDWARITEPGGAVSICGTPNPNNPEWECNGGLRNAYYFLRGSNFDPGAEVTFEWGLGPCP